MEALRVLQSISLLWSARGTRTYTAIPAIARFRQNSSTATMAAQPNVRIIEVGPRDGLQNIAKAIPTTIKVDLIERLRATGLRCIEATSAVSPKAIPQLADNQTLLSNSRVQRLIAEPSTRVPVLVPNVRGLDLAIKHGVKEVAVFVSATEGFSKANTNCTVEEGLRRASEVAALALKSGLQVRGYISTSDVTFHVKS
jgi:hydroxymethylglutaryl-CoA lyase